MGTYAQHYLSLGSLLRRENLQTKQITPVAVAACVLLRLCKDHSKSVGGEEKKRVNLSGGVHSVGSALHLRLPRAAPRSVRSVACCSLPVALCV